MENKTSEQQDNAAQAPADMAPGHPKKCVSRWIAVTISLLQKAEKKIIESFRVPPNGG